MPKLILQMPVMSVSINQVQNYDIDIALPILFKAVNDHWLDFTPLALYINNNRCCMYIHFKTVFTHTFINNASERTPSAATKSCADTWHSNIIASSQSSKGRAKASCGCLGVAGNRPSCSSVSASDTHPQKVILTVWKPPA